MAYYFFESIETKRGSEVKPTLRALPGQTFEDGTPVNTKYNVRAPKEANSAIGGARLDYPYGTIFCSDFLIEDKSKATPFYTVYDSADKEPNFHPVSDDPNFNYVKPSHRDLNMNAAYTLFKAGLHSNTDQLSSTSSAFSEPIPVFTPMDDKGKAKGEIEFWSERYTGQLDEEALMFINWVRRLFREKNISVVRMTAGSIASHFEKLYKCGENIDTLCSRKRFDNALAKEGVSYKDFEMLARGPHDFYLTHLEKEHNNRATCTAVDRNPDDTEDLLDALNLIRDSYANMTGSLPANIGNSDSQTLKEAFKKGWSLPEIIDPEIFKKSSSSLTEFISDLSTGKIPVPVKIITEGASLIESLMSDKKNAKPKDKDGFHIDTDTWKLLVRNLHAKCNTLLLGPTGCGKTDIVKILCKQTGTDLTIIQMGAITDPVEQLVGKLDLDTITGGTVFDWAEFAKAIQKPGVILLDEVNRIPKSGFNILFSCLDDTRALSADSAKSCDNRTIKVHPDCVFFATANIGENYTGTQQLDDAFENRFIPLELDYLSMAMEQKVLMSRTGIKEDDAFNIAFVADKVRTMVSQQTLSKSISTRHTIMCAGLIKDGFSCLEAMQMIFLPLYDKGTGKNDLSSERAQVRNILKQRITE